MLLTFKTVDQVFKIDVDPAEKIKSLKKRIQTDRGSEYIAEGMKLLFAGKILDDEKAIGDYSISDKGFIVIMVPRPKTQGKESKKKSHSNPAQTPGISTIPENTPLAFDAQFSGTNPANPAIPLDFPQWQGHEHLPRSVSYVGSTGSRGKLFESQESSESGQPARRSKRPSFRNSVSSGSSKRVAAMLEDNPMSPHVVAADDAANDTSPLASLGTHELDLLTTPLQGLDEMSKRSEVTNWLDKLVVEQPSSMVELSSNAEETVTQNVQRIVEMGFEKEQAEVALNASFNSVEGALDYLVAGFPAAAQPEPRVPSFAWIPPVVQPPQPVAQCSTDHDDPLEFLKTDEEFQSLRLAVHLDPDLLPSALETIRSSHSDLEPVFEAYEDRLVELLTEPVEDAQDPVPATTPMDTTPTHLPTPDPPSIETPQNTPAGPSQLHVESHQPLDRFDPPQSSSMDVDRTLDPPAASDDSKSSSPAPSRGEKRVPPVGEDASGFETPPEEEVNYESVQDTEEEKLTEDLIRALLMEDQERLEAERQAAAAETISWSDAESLGSGVAGGVGGTGGGRTLEERGYVRVTMEEKQAIDRLKALGFTEERVVQVYLACDKNEEMTANILLDKD